MELFEILERVALVATIALVVYSAVSIRPRRLGLLLGATIFSIASYNVMPLAGDTGFEPWIKHIPVYIGMFGLSLFLQLFARGGATPAAGRLQKAATAFAGFVAVAEVADGMTSGSLIDWLHVLTQQGLQHIVVLPLFTAVFIATIVRSADAPPALRKPLRYLLFAGMAATLIHVMEFLVESQGLIPALNGDPVEVLEIILVFKMLLWFALGIRSARAASPTV